MKKLLEKYNSYHPSPDEEKIKKAFDLAAITYADRKRLNDELWLDHALSVAQIIADLKMDTESICAALLHDSYQFGLTPEEIDSELGSDVKDLVDHIYSMRSISTRRTKEHTDEQYADYLRRVILALGKDLRAVVIRLADKLCGLRSVEVLDEKLRNQVLDSALKVYGPLADFTGVYELKHQIEDVAFRRIDPEAYARYEKAIRGHIYAHDSRINKIESELKDYLGKHGVEVSEVSGRRKAVYSFYRKVKKYQKITGAQESETFSLVYDKVAFRVIVETVEDCYRTLDLIHKRYNYIQSEFDDYIAEPKPNGYKSIQTTVELEEGHYAEVQIKTREMHEYNEYGPGSHFFYKLYGPGLQTIPEDKIKMLKYLLQWRDELLEDSSKASVKHMDEKILVFTPKGQVIELPKDSTPIDFAYSIHSDIGDKAVRALVDGKLRSLDYKLQNGEVVRIVTDPRKNRPSIDWLGFVKTKNAKFHIKRYTMRTR